MSEEEENVNYRDEALRLVAEGKIRHTTKYVEKAFHETVENIYKNFLTKQLDETNEVITGMLVQQISDLTIYLELVENDDSLEKDLDSNEPFKRDVKEFVGLITPCIPYVDLVCGGICIGKHVCKKRSKENKTEMMVNREVFS